MLTKSCEKVAKNFVCEKCHYSTSRKSSYDKHVSTPKHQKLTNVNEKVAKSCNINTSYSILCDNCNKQYKSRVGLWKHKKKCNDVIQKQDNNLMDIIIAHNVHLAKESSGFKELIKEQTKEFKELIMCVCKQIQPINSITNSITNSNINSNNKTFNLNMFLNEECKDAMNIMDFVDSLKLQLSDLESFGKLGFIEGISSIIIKNLKALDIHKRPVHCSDSKREVMYVKDENKWEKENQEKKKLRKAISRIANKNSRLLPEFKAKHPECTKSESVFSDQYNKLVIEAYGGTGDNDLEKEDKIIKKIAKEVCIYKTNE